MLRYGFSTETSPRDLMVAASEWYAALTPGEQTFYHQVLPWMLVGTGVGAICSQTAEIITARIELSSPGWVGELATTLGLPVVQRREAFTKLLIDKFTGYRANVSNESNSDWVRRQIKHCRDDDVAKRFAVAANELPPCPPGYLDEVRDTYFVAEREARIAAGRKPEAEVHRA